MLHSYLRKLSEFIAQMPRLGKFRCVIVDKKCDGWQKEIKGRQALKAGKPAL